jgi:hypothetical protein
MPLVPTSATSQDVPFALAETSKFLSLELKASATEESSTRMKLAPPHPGTSASAAADLDLTLEMETMVPCSSEEAPVVAPVVLEDPVVSEDPVDSVDKAVSEDPDLEDRVDLEASGDSVNLARPTLLAFSVSVLPVVPMLLPKEAMLSKLKAQMKSSEY